MPGFSKIGNSVSYIVFAVIGVLIAIIGTVLIINAVADQGPALQGASNNTTVALTEGTWGSETADSLADQIGEVTPLAFVAMFIGLILAPLGGAVYFAFKAYRGMSQG